jgi:hypothetical protein
MKRRRRRRKEGKNLQKIFEFWSVKLVLISTRMWLILVLCPRVGDVLGCEEVVRGETD